MTITTPEPRAGAAARPGARSLVLAVLLFGLAGGLAAFAPAPGAVEPGLAAQPQAAWELASDTNGPTD